MPNPQNIEKYKFKPGQCGNPNGRPKNRAPEKLAKVMGKSKVKKYYGLTNEEVEYWELSLISLRLDEITALAKDPDIPVYVRGLSMAILTETKRGETKTLDKLREHVYGRAKQQLELTGRITTSVEELTDEEIKEELHRIHAARSQQLTNNE